MSAYTLEPLIKESISKDSDRFKIKTTMKNALQQLPFFPKGIKLQTSDPSYKLRYLYAVDFWKGRKGNEPITKEQALDWIEALKEEINDKKCVYPEREETSESMEILDVHFFKETSTKGKAIRKKSSGDSSKGNLVWYVTCKCDSKFYLKPADTTKAEVEIDMKEIPCSYELIFPGDEVISSDTGGKRSLHITKSTGLVDTCDAEARFIRDLLARLSKDESGVTVFHILCERCQGIWNHIINDDKPFNEDQSVKDIWKLALLLSEKLQSELNTEKSKIFLEDLSSSLFLNETMPQFIQDNASKLSSDDIGDLKSLLELMMQFVPQTATQIWKVAECLANVMHINIKRGNEAQDHLKCAGVKYLIHLGNILAKHIRGYQEVDTTNCEWNKLPTIPTKKEIFTELDLGSLEAIKRKGPYESVGQYLDINFRLLREECFRSLCTGIQNLENSYDPRKMKIYRIKLDTVFYASQTVLVLNYEEYKKEKNESNEENEDSCDVIFYGSLMCISFTEDFDTLAWATVVKGPKVSGRKIAVRLCSERNKEGDIDVLLKLLTAKNAGDYALMAESPTFFQAFGPCMDRLKEMYKEDDMPLVEELVKVEKSKPPEYTLDKEQSCDWSMIFEKPSGYEFTFPKDRQLCPIEQYKHLKEKLCVEMSQSLLDETQLLAVENVLENRVSLIQGPPGTGKSYLGAKILHLMLSMGIHKRYEGPILVMTYKNVALDHFLEPCMEFSSSIVRIGTPKNEKLDKISLENVLERKGVRKNLDRKMRNSLSKLKSLFKCLSNPVFTLQSFFKAASEDHIRSLLTMSPNGNQDISGDHLDDLLSEWKQNNVPKELKERVKKSLNEWLPKDKIKEHFRSCGKKEPVSVNRGKSRVLVTKKNDEEDCFEDAIDKKVVAQERELDAVEEDFKEQYELSKIENEDDPLCDNVKIPFECKTEKEAVENIVDEQLNLWDLSEVERVNYICALPCKIIREFSEAVKSYERRAKCHQQNLDICIVRVLKEYNVIGMTVTGAATRLHLLNQLKPCAVIVEEAAEIIEGHLVSVLPPTIKHLVMLGDQKQLKPSISCYKLKTMKNLDCSMFERLINNNMPYQQLGQQCRMRDDIADLLRLLNIYTGLKTNLKKTCDNIPPDCIGHSLYFVKHTDPESQIQGSSSVWNRREVKEILSVAEYLMKKDYPANDVTVLCPYRGQVDKMKDAFYKRSLDPSDKYLTQLADIKITTVDSFQGEENKVILLSLVRSNREDKIGFFSEENRICVAISRAQCALYMFGNNSVYSASSKKWEKIIKKLEEQKMIGKKFPFKDDPDGVSTPVTDDELFSDSTKLSSPEIYHLSKEIVGVWSSIAKLAELHPGDEENVLLDNVNYPKPINKAARILELINKKPKFSRKKLGEHLKEVRRDLVVDRVKDGYWRNADVSA